MLALAAVLALAVLASKVEVELPEADRFNHVVGVGYDDEREQRDEKDVKGRVVVVQLLLLLPEEMVLDALAFVRH